MRGAALVHHLTLMVYQRCVAACVGVHACFRSVILENTSSFEKKEEKQDITDPELLLQVLIRLSSIIEFFLCCCSSSDTGNTMTWDDQYTRSKALCCCCVDSLFSYTRKPFQEKPFRHKFGALNSNVVQIRTSIK